MFVMSNDSESDNKNIIGDEVKLVTVTDDTVIPAETAPTETTPEVGAVAELVVEPERPISGDVASLLREMDGGAESTAKIAARKATEAQGLKEMQDLKDQLPAGSRPAKPEEVQNRPIPPNSTPILIPPGQTISLELLQKSVSMGLFPMPAPGCTMLEILKEEDRPKMQKLQSQAMQQMQQHAQMRARAQQQQMMPKIPSEHAGMDEDVLPDYAEQHFVGKKLDSFPIGPSGFRIPPSDSFDSLKTVIDWDDTAHRLEVQRTLEGSSYVDATKKLLAGIMGWFGANVLCWYFMCPCGLKRTLAFIATTCSFILYLKTYIRGVAAGYTCPNDYLELTQKEKTAIVTGGTAGIGAEIVKQMFKQEVGKIFVLEKSFMLACQRLAEMKKQLSSEGIDTAEWSSVVEAITCDLSDLNDVYEFTKLMASRKLPVHFLVLNQSEFSSEEPDEENLDKHFLANYLGHFLLFKQLFNPVSAVGGRVITTGFQFYACSKNLDIHQNVFREDSSTPFKHTTSYCNSKAMQVLVTKMFGQRLSTNMRKGPDGKPLPFGPRAMAMSFNPGVVDDIVTKKVMKHSNAFIGPLLNFWTGLVGKTPLEGAQTAFKLLFAPSQLLKQGSYYSEGAVHKTYGPCNIEYPEVKNNVLKLFQMSNVMVLDHSFESKNGENMSIPAEDKQRSCC